MPNSVYGNIGPKIIAFLQNNTQIKLKLILTCKMVRNEIEEKIENQKAYFGSNTIINLKGTDPVSVFNDEVDQIMEILSNFYNRGSNWIFDSIISVDITHDPLRGSMYIELPKEIAINKAIINIKNKDNECFKWCVLRALNPE